jgi:hypothetical protein
LVSFSVAVVLVVVLAACGSGSSKQAASTAGSVAPAASTAASTSQHSSTRAGDTAPSCHLLRPADFRVVGAAVPAKAEQLANSVGQRRTCADLFIDASGGLVLELTETPGGSHELAVAREVARGPSAGAPGAGGQSSGGQSSGSHGAGAGVRTRPLPGIPGGFVVGQRAGFLQRGQVVTLSAGYTTDGQPELTTAQLVGLAGVVARR